MVVVVFALGKNRILMSYIFVALALLVHDTWVGCFTANDTFALKLHVYTSSRVRTKATFLYPMTLTLSRVKDTDPFCGGFQRMCGISGFFVDTLRNTKV